VKLTENQKRFADYYIETGNASEAYLKAGYKVKSADVAKVNASRLLTNANVKQYIDEMIASKDEDRIAKQDEVLEFLTKVLRGEIKVEIPLGEGMGAQTLVMKELAGKDRLKAAELLGKRYTLWTDKTQLEGTLGVQIVDDIND
jgi:phage terminase small subunit